MSTKEENQKKSRLHARNRNRDRYDLDALIVTNPNLQTFIRENKYGVDSIDFSDPTAVKELNKSILHHYYGIKNWKFPDSNLCPPIPGRADYLHYLADLLSQNNFGKFPKGENITCLDIGVGANCIYPILGVVEYGWNFIGSDIDANSIKSSLSIIDTNPILHGKVTLKRQSKSKSIFKNILNEKDFIDITMCNPPFHLSKEEAAKGTSRKIKNLSGKEEQTPLLNFSGISNELVYAGGERQFIENMIKESELYPKNCLWFSTLVSKQSNLKWMYHTLEQTRAIQIKTIPMGTGNKSSRIVAWSFLSSSEFKEWREIRWK